MRKINDVLRVKLEARFFYEQIAASLAISKSAASKYGGKAAAAGLDWNAIAPMRKTALEQHIVHGCLDLPNHYALPEYGRIHQDLRRKGMTLVLLWE